MSNSISQSFQPSGIEVFRRKGKDEPSNVSKIYGSVLFVLSLAGTVFLTLSLATFSGMDPGFSMANSFPESAMFSELPVLGLPIFYICCSAGQLGCLLLGLSLP